MLHGDVPGETVGGSAGPSPNAAWCPGGPRTLQLALQILQPPSMVVRVRGQLQQAGLLGLSPSSQEAPRGGQGLCQGPTCSAVLGWMVRGPQPCFWYPVATRTLWQLHQPLDGLWGVGTNLPGTGWGTEPALVSRGRGDL